jgi:hypothetical protein
VRKKYYFFSVLRLADKDETLDDVWPESRDHGVEALAASVVAGPGASAKTTDGHFLLQMRRIFSSAHLGGAIRSALPLIKRLLNFANVQFHYYAIWLSI